MGYFTIQMASGELYHYGILGQKWGKRNGPPYPLSSASKSASEKNASKSERLKSGFKKYSAATNKYNRDVNKIKLSSYTRKVSRKKNESVPKYLVRAYKKGREIQEDNRKKTWKVQDEYFNTLFSEHPNIMDARKKLADIYRDETTQKILKGMVIAAGAVYIGYTVKDLQVSMAVDRSMAYRRLSSQFSKIPISELSGKVDTLPAEQTLQRLVRVPRNFTGSKSNLDLVREKEADWDKIYATYKKNDNRIYQAVFNMRGSGVQVISTRKTTQNLVGASERQRVMTFMQLFNTSQEFREGFVKDMGWHMDEAKKLDPKHSRQYYKQFSTMLGKSNSNTAPIYFNKLKEKGYDFLIDDNDAHGLGNSPVIILNADKNTVITGAKAITNMDRIISTILIDTHAIRH